MIHRLLDAKNFCAEFVGNGKATTDPDVVSTLNEATQMFMNKDKLWKHTVQKLKLCVLHNTITLPQDVEAALGVCVEGSVRGIHGMNYEFLEGGPGALMCGNNINYHDLVDLGDGFPCFYEIGQKQLKVAAFSTETNDIGKNIRLRGKNWRQMDIGATTPGEVIQVQRWLGGVEGEIDGSSLVLSTNAFKSIESVIKDETEGYITLLAYDDGTTTSVNEDHWHTATVDSNRNGTTDTQLEHSHTVSNDVISTTSSDLAASHKHDDLERSMYILSKYHPYETQPGYRRYRFTGITPPKEIKESTDNPHCVLLLVKMRYVPLRDDTDVLPIQNLIAYKWMCRAIHKNNEGDLEGGLSYQAMAENELAQQVSGYEMGNQHVVDMSFAGYRKQTAESVI